MDQSTGGFALTILLAGSAALSGCGGIQPGDYAFYRVAYASEELSDDCYPDGRPLDEVGDSSTFRAADTLIVYRGPEDAYYLDTGAGLAMTGAEGDDGFSFRGESVDVQYFGDADASNTESTTSVTVTLSDLAGAISGTQRIVETAVCNGADCTPELAYSCTTTVAFEGTEVDDVDLQHALE